MPVAAKLSRKFYDRLGEDVANELVDLLNLIDSTYKSELRDANDANWARFETKLHAEIHALRADQQTLKAELQGALKDLRSDLLMWMFIYWTATAAAGLVLKAIGFIK